jgi:hypothetical protein
MSVSLVGKNIDAHCLKCKLVLAHIVLYEVRGIVSKVKCKTCGAEHKYRGVKPPAKKSGPAVRTLKENRPIKAAASNINSQAPMQWVARHDHINSETPVKDYLMQGSYQANDVIRHPLFGLGFVERIVSDKRMDVLFQDAIKPMVMNIPS